MSLVHKSISTIDDYNTKNSTVDDLSSDSEDDFPPGFLTAKLEKQVDDAGSDDGSLTDDIIPFNTDLPQVEFHPLTYKERKFAEKMRKRIDNRNIRPKATLGTTNSAFRDLSLNINAQTTEIDLSGQPLTDESLSSLWSLISETTILRRVSLSRTNIGAHHGEPIHQALIKNKGSLESLNLKRNNLNDDAIATILDLNKEHSNSLCAGNLRILDFRGNILSEKSGLILSNAARLPKQLQVTNEGSGHGSGHDSLSVISASPLPWQNSSSSYQSSSQSSSQPSSQSSMFSSIQPSKVSRFDELNGIPTESLLNNELQYLQFGSSGFGVAEVALIGELLKHVTSVTSLDLSWNNELGADGAIALANTLSMSKSPIEMLDLSGTRICDLDEKCNPVSKSNSTYGGTEAKEPILVDSIFRSDGVVALCFMLRSNKGVAKSLRELRLNDNCLCLPYKNKNEERFLEWQYPPNAYDRTQVTENTEVLAHVMMPGVGPRLVMEWHEGLVADCKASLKKGVCDFAINFNDNRTQKLVARAHDKLWDMEQAKEKAEFKKQCEVAEARGRPSPTPKWAKHKPSVRVTDKNIKILQESGALFAIAELLKHGIPPPATPEEIWKASQEKQAQMKQQRQAMEASQAEKSGTTSTNNDENQMNTMKGSETSTEEGGASSKKQSSSNKKSKNKKQSSSNKNKKGKSSLGDVSLADHEEDIAAGVDADLFHNFGQSIGGSTTVSSWHISEEFEDTLSQHSNESELNKFNSMPADVMAFEAEAENVLNSYLQEEGQEPQGSVRNNGGDNIDVEKDGDKTQESKKKFQLSRYRSDDSLSNSDEDDEGSLGEESFATSTSSHTGSHMTTDSQVLPGWAKSTGGEYGEMRVGIQRLELKRCAIDDAGVRWLAPGLEHPACPISSLHLDGNFLGGESGAMGLTNALDLNRSLTFLGLVGCELSMLVRREWSMALNSNSKSRLSCIAIDAVTVVPRPLKQRYDPSTNHKHRIIKQQTKALPDNILVNKHKVSFVEKKVSEVTQGTSYGENNSLENQIVQFEGIKGNKGTNKEQLLSMKQKLKNNLTALLDHAHNETRPLKVGDLDSNGDRIDNIGFEPWKAAEYQDVISRFVASSDCLVLASVIARNRYLLGLNLNGSSFDMESFQILIDALSVQSRLLPPEEKRETDEDYISDENAFTGEDTNHDCGNGEGGDISPLDSPETSPRSLSLMMTTAAVGSPSASFNHSSSPSALASFTLPASGSFNLPPEFPKTLPHNYKRTSLISLSLAGVYLGADGCSILTDGMADLFNLKYLCLRGCQLTDFGSNNEAATKFVSALEGTIPLVPPPTPPPPKFGKRAKEPKKETAPVAVASAPPQHTAVNDANKHRLQAPNNAVAGKTTTFWKVPVGPPSKKWGASPKLRFLDLGDNGLPANLVWRCVLFFRNHVEHMKWLDLSGNMIYDMNPTRLDVDPSLWARHNMPPFVTSLTLPMRKEVLFAGQPVEWVVQPENNTDTNKGSMYQSFSGGGSNAQPATSKQIDDSYGEMLATLTAKACHHGAPPLFLVTGKAAVEAKVEAVLEDKPEAYVAARVELRNAAWRQQRLTDLIVEIEAAKENVKYVLHKHAVLDKRKEYRLQQEAEKAEKERILMEKEILKSKQETERHLMHDADIEMLKIRKEEKRILKEIELKAQELILCTKEISLMSDEDEDINDYIFKTYQNKNSNHRNDQHANGGDVNVNGGDHADDGGDEGEEDEHIPKTQEEKEIDEENNEKRIRCKVRKVYFQLPNAKESFEVSWQYFNNFLSLLNIKNFNEIKCNQISQIYYNYKNDELSKKPLFFNVYDAKDLYQISELAKIFYDVDLDDSGGISADELSACLIKLGYDMPNEKCIELLGQIDSNNDGIVSLEEFVIFFRYVKLEIRLAAEAKLVQSAIGKNKTLDLTKKLGMIVNPDGVIAKVTEGGQADVSLGIRPGCRLIQCNNEIIDGLYELKATMQKAKKAGLKQCSIVYVNPKEHARAKHQLAKLKAESSLRSAQAAEQASLLAEQKKNIAIKNEIRLKKANEESRKQAIIDQELLKKQLIYEKEQAIYLAAKRKKDFDMELKKKKKNFKAEKLRLQQEELRIKKEQKEIEDNIAKEAFKRETAEISAKSQLARLRNEQDELTLEGEEAAMKAAARWGKTELLPQELMLKNKPKKRRSRLRYVLAAVPHNRSNYKLFIFAMSLVSIFDMKKTGPGSGNRRNKNNSSNDSQSSSGSGGGRKMSRNAEVKIMTCELRCIRAWARENYENNTSQLLQDLRYILITRLMRSDVATWIRELLFRKSPKPKISIEHEDGSYLVYDERLGWIVRLELKTAPCDCEPCQDHSTEFPAKSQHFVLPDVNGLLPETTDI